MKNYYDSASDLISITDWPKRHLDYIIIHHSATMDSRLHDWYSIERYHTSYRIDGNIIASSVKVMDPLKDYIKFHDKWYNSDEVKEFERREIMMEGKVFEEPWIDIAYNFGLEKINDSYFYCLGRSLDMSGAHAVGFNSNSVGICMIGSFDKFPPSDTQFKNLVSLIQEIQKKTNIEKDKILGHWETFLLRGMASDKEEAWKKFKTCPGKCFDMEEVRKNCL